jgi:translation initiation factor IF-3
MKTRIGEHDRSAKVRQAKRLLDEGSKVKVTIMFRGREMDHPELGMALLRSVANDLTDEATLDSPPQFVGRFLSMILSPIPEKEPVKTKQPVESAT